MSWSLTKMKQDIGEHQNDSLSSVSKEDSSFVLLLCFALPCPNSKHFRNSTLGCLDA